MIYWKNLLGLTATVVLVAAFAVGCPDEEEAVNNEVVIGYSGPLSGPAAEYGEENRDGIKMAINDLNEAGGLSIGGEQYTLKLEALDDEAEPSQAVSNSQRLRDMHDVPAVFNPVATSISPTLEINEEADDEFIMMAYTSTPLELQYDNDLAVYISPSFTSYVQHQAQWAAEEGWEDIAMLVTAGAYGDGWREAFELLWEEELDGNIIADHPVNYYEQTDFSTEITSILDQEADAILIGGPSATTALAIEQAREMGFDGGFILIDQAKINYLEEVLGDMEYLEDMIAQVPPEFAYTPGAAEFDERVEAEFEPTAVVWEHALMYNAMFILARAMEEADSIDDPYAIRQAMPDVLPLLDDETEYPLAFEYYDIFDNGRLKGVNNIAIVEDGKFGELETNVWPAETQEEFEKVRNMLTIGDHVTEEGLNFLWFKEYGVYEPYDW